MTSNASIFAVLRGRLRRAPSPSSVPGSLPVLFFGDLLSARIATVGLNPSHQEYLDKAGNELDGTRRRFETLDSLRATDRDSLSDEQCDRAVATMRAYFQPGKPVYAWFRSLDRVIQGMGAHYGLREAAHLDLVQEATKPTWSKLPTNERERLLAADESFLKWQLNAFPLEAVVCNGRTAFDIVCCLTRARLTDSGKLARVTWFVAVASVPGREFSVVGWNLPLARPTGLTGDGQRELGHLLRERIPFVADPIPTA